MLRHLRLRRHLRRLRLRLRRRLRRRRHLLPVVVVIRLPVVVTRRHLMVVPILTTQYPLSLAAVLTAVPAQTPRTRLSLVVVPTQTLQTHLLPMVVPAWTLRTRLLLVAVPIRPFRAVVILPEARPTPAPGGLTLGEVVGWSIR